MGTVAILAQDPVLCTAGSARNWLRHGRDRAGHGVVVAGGNGPGSALNQLFWPRGVAFAPDGAVIVADEKNDRVVRWDEGAHEGIVVAGGHGRGNALSQLCGPVGVALTKSGDILVAAAGSEACRQAVRPKVCAASASQGMTREAGRRCVVSVTKSTATFSFSCVDSDFARNTHSA